MPKFDIPPIDTIKKPIRKVRAAADAAFLEHAETAGKAPGGSWDIILDSTKGKFVRTKALFAALRDVVPDALFHRLTGRRYEFMGDALPINPEQYELEEGKIGSGFECNVYKLTSRDPQQPSLVIKIDRTGTENVDALIERGKQVRSEWEMIKGWYQDIPSLVPDEYNFIGHSPIGGGNALFTIQKYFGTADALRDFFHDVSRKDLLVLLEADSQFRTDFMVFARVTLKRAEEHDEMIDTIGNNLFLVTQGNGKQLILLDPHVVKHPKGTNIQNEREELNRQLNFLRDMLAEAEIIDASVEK